MSDLVEISTFQLTQKTIPLKDLRKWKLFSTIGDSVLQNVRLAHVHDKFGFLVTTDDNVYAFGTGFRGSLGIGTITQASLPVKIDTLCGQTVKEFATGGSLWELPSCFAITSEGLVFAWGDNSYGQLGVGSNGGPKSTPTLVCFDERVQISKISLGNGHAVALTMDTSEVFSWGWNKHGQLGFGNSTDQNKPCKITKHLGNIRVTQISCGTHSSFALSESGDVYSWGYNGHGELGLGNTTSANVPTKVSICQPVKKIANGMWHTILLTTSGEIFVCGNNSQGQLGTGNTTNLSVLTKLSGDLGIFDDVSCVPMSNQPSYAKSGDRIFVWGQIHAGLISSKPIELDTELSSFPYPPTIFKGTAQVMCRSLCASDCAENGPTIHETLQTAIGGAGTDTEFKVEGDLIRVHKPILILRSDYFARKFAQDWKQQEMGPIEIQDVKRDTFYAKLYYLYTDKIYFSDVEIDKILDLMQIATKYADAGLKAKCESVLKKQLTLENVFTIYAAAGKCNAHHLRDAAFDFGVANWVEISTSEVLEKANLSSEDMRQFMKVWATKYKDAQKMTQNVEPKMKPEPIVDKKIEVIPPAQGFTVNAGIDNQSNLGTSIFGSTAQSSKSNSVFRAVSNTTATSGFNFGVSTPAYLAQAPLSGQPRKSSFQQK